MGGLFKPKDEFELEFLVGTLVGYLLDRPLPSSTGPLFQNEGRCSAFDMKIIFHSHANKTHFHKRGCAPILGDPGAVSRVDVKVCCLLASI